MARMTGLDSSLAATGYALPPAAASTAKEATIPARSTGGFRRLLANWCLPTRALYD
jgi:hypothetical protein